MKIKVAKFGYSLCKIVYKRKFNNQLQIYYNKLPKYFLFN